VGLWFDSDEPTDAQLWVYAERDELGSGVCTADQLGEVCSAAYSEPGLRPAGVEILRLHDEPGVYGFAVAPAAATPSIRATLRVSNGGVHLGWFGPRTLVGSLGEVWLAGRVLSLGGTVRLEPIGEVQTGLPTAGVLEW
jgi:hypothetical protein